VISALLNRAVSMVLAGLLLIAQPGPCPCWLYTFWRIEDQNQAFVPIRAVGHDGHDGHVMPTEPDRSDAPERADDGSLRVGVNQPPRPQPASVLLAEMAEQTIHWLVRFPASTPAAPWTSSPEPPPPRAV
jgi:hypothetical protein